MATDTSKESTTTKISTILLTLALTLVIIGALNWGATAFGTNLVELVSGKDTVFSKAIYSLVALSGVGVSVALLTKKMKVKC